MRRYFVSLIFICLLSLNTQAQLSTRKVKILFVGDAMQHKPQITTAEKQGWDAHFEQSFQYVTPSISAADYAVVNFETTVGPPPFTGYPNFSTSRHFARKLSDVGFDLFMLSNNHILDKGSLGLKRTILEFNSLKKEYIGAYNSEMDKQANYPMMIHLKGMKIALLSYTYGTNSGLSNSSSSKVNYLDTLKIESDLKFIKQQNPDFIITMLHWGAEYQLQPSAKQRQVANFLYKNGVNAIIGSHPHVVQPIEIVRDSAGRVRNVIAYSLGNFVSNQYFPYSQISMTMTLQFEQTMQGLCMIEPLHCLYWVDRSPSQWGRNYQLVPLDMEIKPNTMSQEEWLKMQLERVNLRKNLPSLFSHLSL